MGFAGQYRDFESAQYPNYGHKCSWNYFYNTYTDRIIASSMKGDHKLLDRPLGFSHIRVINLYLRRNYGHL
jgi:hypothetical protein